MTCVELVFFSHSSGGVLLWTKGAQHELDLKLTNDSVFFFAWRDEATTEEHLLLSSPMLR